MPRTRRSSGWSWVLISVLLGCSDGREYLEEKKPRRVEKAPFGDPYEGLEATPDPAVYAGEPATVAPNPISPARDDGSALSWPAAPELKPVSVVANRDSAVVIVPAVPGARDYRAYALPAGASLEVRDGTEWVNGTTLFCAGFRQRNAPATSSLQVMRQIEVTGLDTETRLVIEAVDRPCPFPGAFGSTHADIDTNPTSTTNGITFSLYTEEEIRSLYGSFVVNGHGPPTALAMPANLPRPRVLARTTIVVRPTGRAAPRVGTFFDDFANNGDQPVRVATNLSDGGRSQRGTLFQSSKWSFYTYGAEHADFFFDRGQLFMVNADWRQEIFSTTVAYPRKVAQLPPSGADRYLHLTYEVPSNSTARRYWWLSLCGAASAGRTLDANGRLLGRIVQTPFFYQSDGLNPSVEGWNCLQVFPRDGWPFELAPTDTRPESDVRVMVNRAAAPERDNVVNVSPNQYGGSLAPRSWYRRQGASGGLVGALLDDQMLISPRARYDVYVRRDRVIIFVNGQQRLCNDFPNHALTMAEAAVGLGTVLYHSSAERAEFTADYWDRTGQRYYLSNTPFVDIRAWDNAGFAESVPAPSSLDASSCHVYR